MTPLRPRMSSKQATARCRAVRSCIAVRPARCSDSLTRTSLRWVRRQSLSPMGSLELAQKLANELGQAMWDRRQGLAGTFIVVDEASAQAARMPGPVCLLDMGDNVGGGSPGDGTWIAHELLRTGVGPVFGSPTMGKTGAADATGVGRTAQFAIGGRSDDLHGAPLEAEFTVQKMADGGFSESEVRHGGITDFDQGRTAILSNASGSTVMVTSRRTPPSSACAN